MNEQKEQEKSKKFKFLPLSLRLETKGGIATPLVLRGTPLPAIRNQVFSTAVDNQDAVTLSIFIGESPIVQNNLLLQTFDLTNISKAPKGDVEISVTFKVDQDCVVEVNAIEKKSGHSIKVDGINLKTTITQEKISELLLKAEMAKDEDERLLKLREAKNEAESLIHRAEGVLREERNVEKSRKIEKIIALLGLALESDNSVNIRLHTQELNKFVPSNTFPDFFGTDIFSNFFEQQGGIQKGVIKRSPLKTSKPETGKKGKNSINDNLSNQINGSSQNTRKAGKIFGGGDFTLDPNLCFVLMPFDCQFHPVYDDHIRNVVKAEGLSCLRADEITSTNIITWDIWEKINRARFIIADLSGKNANVFYEVGVAHTLSKDVILLTRDIEDVPFDLKALRCIVYAHTPEGMKEMSIKLKATIKDIMKS